MNDDSGTLSVDFLVGFTIFLLAFVWVVSMIPGLLIGLQSYTIDYDAVAYRTGVILVEDPGEPALPQVPWEINNNKRDVVRFGLAISRDTPNILSENKVNRFFCSTVFSYPEDYQRRAIFGDYPYQFNISVFDINRNSTLYVGDSMASTYGTIRRLVQIKGVTNATINATNTTYLNARQYISGDNETRHEFTILINNTRLISDTVRSPAYQINPARDPLTINITGLNSTLYPDRERCFNITLAKIYAEDQNLIPIHLFNDPVIDGVAQHVDTETQYASLPTVQNNLSVILAPTFLPWSNYPQVYLNITFDLKEAPSNPGCDPSVFTGGVTGSRFLNNSRSSPFEYNYTATEVTQPSLRNAVIEIKVGSGYRAETGSSLINQLLAQFDFTPIGGTTVDFTDHSTGSPVEWLWTFGDGNTSTLSDPTHTFPGPGTYTVSLIVRDSGGNPNGPVTKTIDLYPPVADFSGTPLSGAAPLSVIFSDSSTYSPTSWSWNFGDGNTSSGQNPIHIYSTPGTYTVRLTATNAVGSNTAIKTGYITVIPQPIASFTANQTSGVVSLPVQFTDTSINNPNAWTWEFRNATVPWTQFSTSQNPAWVFYTGVHDIRLTVRNTTIPGSDTMTRTSYITVTAVPITHAITASAGAGGSIAPTGTVNINHGGSQTFTITPNVNYHIVNVLVDGVSNGTISSYSFTNVVADHTISATFAANPSEVLFLDNFNAAFSGWTQSGTVNWYAGSPRNGSHSIQLQNTGRFTRTVSTVGYTGITVSCALAGNSLESGETVQAQYSTNGGGTWTAWATLNDWEDDSNFRYFANIALPAAANNNANFMIRFRIYGNSAGDYGYIDDVVVRGTHI